MPAFARTIQFTALLACLLIQDSACAAAADLATSLAAHSQLSAFYRLINHAGLAGVLRSRAGLTVFAPTNRAIAFAMGPNFVGAGIRARPGVGGRALRVRLQHLVRGHMVAVILPPSALIGQRRTFTDVAGTERIIDGTEAGVIAISTVPVAVSAQAGGKQLRVRTAHVFGRTIPADNGIIYPIDAVLMD